MAQGSGDSLTMRMTDYSEVSYVNTLDLKEDKQKEDFIVLPSTLRAVEQKPEPGTLVPQGSTIVVFFEDVDSMMLHDFQGGHAGYAGKKAREVVEEAEKNNAVKDIFKAAKEKKDLTPEEKEILITFFTSESVGLEIDEAHSDKNFEAAYKVLAASYELMGKK